VSPYVRTVRTASGAPAVQIDSAPLRSRPPGRGTCGMPHARAYRVLGLEQSAPSKSKPAGVLVMCDVLASHRRATEVRLTDQGWQASPRTLRDRAVARQTMTVPPTRLICVTTFRCR
jgi:hypothetical protein